MASPDDNATEEQTSHLLGSWDIGDVTSTEPIESYWGHATAVTVASGKRYVMKRRERSGDGDKETDLLRLLERSGVPVAVPIMTRTGAPHVVSDESEYALYSLLRGHVVRDHYGEGATARARRFGRAIALLHTALRDLPSAGDGLVTTSVDSGCRPFMWFNRVRRLRNSSVGDSDGWFTSMTCASGLGLHCTS